MEISPYLEAIQKIAGSNPGEKYRTLNRIAQTIIEDSEKTSKPIQFHAIEGLPEPLVPLVKLETARISCDPEGVVNALKSDDEIVFQRAVAVKWFFDGSLQNYPNAGHFKEEIFPYVSVNHRTKLIRVLATILANKQQKIAEDFYSVVRGIYGDKQARPLLKACTDTFIWDLVVKDNIRLNLDEVKCLYPKYPELIIKYLRLGIKSSDEDSKNSNVNLYHYLKFIPTLIKKHSNFFVELIVKSKHHFNLKLDSHRTNKFLKRETESLLKNPELFMPMLLSHLKLVTRKLSLEQFAIVYQKQLPKKLEDFQLSMMYLEYIPDDQKMQLILSSFEKVYQTSLLNFPKKIPWFALILLDPEERVKQARQKLATDKKWYTEQHGWDIEKSWRCYLPANEAIAMIKTKLSKTESAQRRMMLLEQMIMTCKINKDSGALLEVLKFVSTRHKNERENVLTEFLSKLSREYQLQLLPSEHWDVLYDFVKLMHSKNEFGSNLQLFWEIITRRIEFNLMHNQLITEEIEFMTKIVEGTWWDRFTVFKDKPQYEKMCLNEFSKLIPTIYAKHQRENTYNWKRALTNFSQAIFEFNEFNVKAKNGIPKMSIKEHPWLLEGVKKFVSAVINKEDDYNLREFMILLKENEPESFGHLEIEMEIDNKDVKKPEIDLKKSVNILKKNPQEVLDDWEKYYDVCKRVSYRKYTQRFLRCCRWYQEIPIKFLQAAVKDVLEDNYCYWSIIVLATLLEGSAFEKFVTSHKSTSKHVNTASLRVINPPVPLGNLLQVIGGETIGEIAVHVYTLRNRIAVDKLQSISQDFIKRRRLVIKKYGIRILEAVNTISEWQNALVNLWKEEKHRSIRILIADKIRKAFTAKPCAETWTMMEACIDGLSMDDNDILESVAKFQKVPNEFMMQYVRKLLMLYKKFRDATDNGDRNDDDDNEHPDTWSHVEELLNALTPQVAASFPDEFHKEIFQDFLVAWPLPKKIIIAAQRYLVNCYLLAIDDREVQVHRTQVFRDFLREIIKKLDKPDPKDESYYPANYFIRRLINSVIVELPNTFNKWKLIDTLLLQFSADVGSPNISPEFFCYFSLAVHYQTSENRTTTPEEFAVEVSKELCQLIEIFSSEIIALVANVLYHLIRLFFKDNPQLKIIRYLLESSNRPFDDSLAVALLMCQKVPERNEEFWKIVRSCRKHRKIIVSSTARMIIDRVHY